MPGSSFPSSLAIRSAYAHHGDHAGYKQILRYTRPKAVFGVDERETDAGVRPYLYKWMYEFAARRYAARHPVDVVHVLYGEEYFRFSDRLFRSVPVIATFHQPPERLRDEIKNGGSGGRVARVTHRLNPARFTRLRAAIVMTEPQKKVLAEVMDAHHIHVIPLGIDLERLRRFAANHAAAFAPETNTILTVGNWGRDWEFYFRFLAHCRDQRPDLRFILVNRKLSESYQTRAAGLPNLTYLRDVTDEDLYTLYMTVSLQFLPFSAAAGNNALNEGLAFGCPVVTNVVDTDLEASEIFIRCCSLRVDEVVQAFDGFLSLSHEKREAVSRAAGQAVEPLDWTRIGQRTLDVYRSVL